MIIKLSLLFAFVHILRGEIPYERPNWELHLKGFTFDWTSKSQFLNKTHLLVVTQTRSFDQKYQAELQMIDLRDNSIPKSMLVGNLTEDTYSPNILVVQQSIYIAYISQYGSIIKLNLMTFDLEFNQEGGEFFLGTTIESAKYDLKFCYLNLNLLDKNTVAILWYSYAQASQFKQWNYREINHLNKKLTETFVLPDSIQISVALNQFGIRAIVQNTKTILYFSKIQDGTLTTKKIMYEQNGLIKVFCLPNNKFVYVAWYTNSLLVKQFDTQFNPMFDPIKDGLQFHYSYDLASISMKNYDLLMIGQDQNYLSLGSVDIRDFIINKKEAVFQERIFKFTDYIKSYDMKLEIIENNFYVRWLYQNYNSYQKYYNLALIQFDMSYLIKESVDNCLKQDLQYKCLECEEGYILNGIDNKCTTICPDNCDICSNPIFCDKCKQGYQYSTDNQCVDPSNTFIDLRISDETFNKGKPRMLIVENELIVIYGIFGPSNSYLKIKKLNSIGKEEMWTDFIEKSSQLRDYDITYGDDDKSFRLLVKWFQNGYGVIIEYLLNLEDLTTISQLTIKENLTPDMKGDQIKFENTQSWGVCYFYLIQDKDNKYYYLYSQTTDQNGQKQGSNLISFVEDGLKLHSITNNNYIYIQIQSNQCLYTYYLHKSYYPSQINSQDFTETELYFQKKFFLDFSNFFYIDLNEYNTSQLFLQFTEKTTTHKIQITQSSRNPRSISGKMAGLSHVFVAWLGESNVEISQQVEQIYLQRISLETYQIEDIKKVICSSNCQNCNDQGKCLKCKNNNYQLINGRCILQCQDNCDKCEIENQCMICKSSYYLNENLQCILYEQNYISSLENVKAINLYYFNQNLITVYLKYNQTRLEVILEEFDNHISISGEIKISNDDDYLIVQQQPKVIKKGFYYFVSYLTLLVSGKYQRVLVILNDAYQLCSKNLLINTETAESDVFVTDSLTIYCFSTYYYYSYLQLRLQSYSFLSGQISEQNWWSGSSIFDGNSFKNVRFGNNQKPSVISLLFTHLKDGAEIDYFTSFDEGLQKFGATLKHRYLEYYENKFEDWTLLYDFISSTQIKLQFYDNNQVVQKEYIIGSLNKIFSFMQLSNDYYIYFAYLESTSLTTINVNQYDINGNHQKTIQINTNENQIRDLGMAVSDQFIQLSWTSNSLNKSYRALLNQELQQIPLNSQICLNNCKNCNESQQCILCLPGFSLENDNCKPICSDNCQQCSTPYTCDYCLGNFKYVDNKCQDISSMKIEQSVCQETCYGVSQALQFDNNNVIITYQDFDQTQYSIKIKSYKVDNSISASIKTLFTQPLRIAYHQLFQYTQGKFALVWLSGDCTTQCRLMLQLFNQDFSQITNELELRALITDLNYFNLQIKKYNSDILLVWCEFDSNQISQIYVGQYIINSGFSIKYHVQQNQNDISTMPQMIILSGKYQIIYLVNQKVITMMTGGGSAATYKQIYTAENMIIELSSVKTANYGILIGWIEIFYDQWSTCQYLLKLQLFDQEGNPSGGQFVFPTNNKEIKNLLLTNDDSQVKYILYYVEKGYKNQHKIKSYISYVYQIQYGFSDQTSQQVNIISHYEPNTIFNAYQSDYSKHFITFEGKLDNKKQIFIQERQSTNNFLSKCPDHCYYCDSNNKCILCLENYQISQNLCVQKLPDFCEVGSLGKCSQCSEGYQVTTAGLCSLSDPQFRAIKLNPYSFLNKQRLSSFQNGNIIVVWYRQYYQSEGTGVYMSLFNVHGDTLVPETRISQSSEGIQAFPDVQVLSTDEVICTWLDGDLTTGSKIKLQRFSNTLTRIGDEIILKENIKLTSIPDNPLLIQSIINGFVIVWTETQQDMYINFYDNEANQLKQWKLNDDGQIQNFEPVVSSNQQIIAVLWCSQTQTSDIQIRLSKFSLNHVLIDSEILSENGEAPSVDVLSDGSFIFTWREPYVDQYEVMSKKIVYRKYSPDLSQQQFSHYLGEVNYNQKNPDVIHTNNGFAIVYENINQANSDIRNLKMQYFDLLGQTTNPLITVANQQGMYPHHPQLTLLPQGQFIVSYVQSTISQVNLNDDVLIKRYDSNGDQLLLSTIVCSSNCLTCESGNVCQECLRGFVLLNQQCYKEIENCKTYSDIGVCTDCKENYNLEFNICRLLNQQLDLSVEIITNFQSIFRALVFQNGDLGYFWYDNYLIWFQKFNSSGYPLTQPYNITGYSIYYQNKFCLFDVVVVDEKHYLLAILDYGSIKIGIINSQTNEFTTLQTNYQQYYADSFRGLDQDQITSGLYKIAVQLRYIDESTLGLFFLNKNSQGIGLRMELLLRLSNVNNYGVIYKSSISSSIWLSSPGELDSSTSDNFDVQIQGGHISILKAVQNKTAFAYLYQIYDQQGHIISSYRVPYNNKRIDFTLLQFSPQKFIEAWTQLGNEVYYQFKQFDGVHIADPIKVSNSEEKYRFDVKLVKLNRIIVLTWREGFSPEDIIKNTRFKAAIISLETELSQVISLDYSPQNSTLEILQLPNQDIVFTFIDNGLGNLKSVKFSPSGEKLTFNTPRCNYGCQECNQQLYCFKCLDSSSYILTTQGTCIDYKINCLNFDSSCKACLKGYYMTKYQTCEAITQIQEKVIPYQENPYKLAYYPDGRFLFLYIFGTYLEAIVYSPNGSIIKNRFTILPKKSSYSDFSIIGAALNINPDDSMSLVIVYNKYGNSYVHFLLDSNYIQVGEDKVLYFNPQLQYYDNIDLQIKQLSQKSIGLMIKTWNTVYFAVYSTAFQDFVGNLIFNYENYARLWQVYNVDLDFVSTQNNIVFTYTAGQQESIVKIYDSKFNFIKDIILSDGSLIKAGVNSLDQVVIVTQYQINFIEGNTLISSIKYLNQIYPVSLVINSKDEIQVLSKTAQVSYPLILISFDQNGKLLFEKQVNMYTTSIKTNSMNLLQNDFVTVIFIGNSNISYQQLHTVRFDSFGVSRDQSEIICPKGCDVCTSSNSCQLCSNGYQRDEQTLLCRKICAVIGCKSCEITQCDRCQDQMQLYLGICTQVVSDPLPNELQIADECQEAIKQKVIKFSNTDYALVYYCQKQITIKRYTRDNVEIVTYTNQFDNLLFDFDVTVVQDVIYIIVVIVGKQNEAQIYKYNLTWSSVSVITYTSQITQAIIVGLPSHYSIFLSGNNQEKIENIYMTCSGSSFYSFDITDTKTYEKLQFNPPLTIQDCNRNKIKSVASYGQWIYVLSNEENGVKIATLSSFGQIAFQIIEIALSEEIYFQADSVQFAIISKISGTKIWKLYLLDIVFKIIFINDNFIEGDYAFSLAITDVSITIAYNQIGQASVVQYQILDKLGTLVNQGYVANSAISKNPVLIQLNSNLVGFSWSGVQVQYGLSYAVIDQTGKFVNYLIVCSDNCETCTSPVWCTKCQQGYFQSQNNLDKSQLCSQLISEPNCLSYSNEGKCIECDESYILQSGKCILDQTEKNTLIVNQGTEFNQIQPNGVSFKDGSLLVVWTSMNQDGDSWGIYAQLHNPQGQKIGDNIRVNQNTIGPQHSPRVAVLSDDTVLIIYIDGNPQDGAKIIGIRYNNQLTQIGIEIEFATFTYIVQYLNLNYLINIEALFNGGFIVGYVENTNNYYDQINLLFYDQNHNQVTKNIVYCLHPDHGNYIFQFASTQSTVVAFYIYLNYNFKASVYSFNGQIQNTVPMNDINFQLMNKLRGSNEYYGLIKRVITSNQCELQFQLYTNQFIPYGNQIIIDTISIDQYPSQIQMGTYNSGFLIAIHIFGDKQYLKQYFVNLDWEITQLNNLYLYYPSGFFLGFTYVGTPLSHYYILYQQFFDNYYYESDQCNIALQKYSKSGVQLSIDEIACSKNCQLCESSGTCKTCIENYQIKEQICEPICENYCQVCINPQICKTCISGYYQKIDGKCSLMPNDYIQPEPLLALPYQDNILGLDEISSNEFVIFTQQNMEQFTVSLFKDLQLIKQIKVQVTQTPNYLNIYPFYVDDNLVLIVYYSDKIIVKRFDAQAQTLLDSQINNMPPLIDSYYDIIVEPIENNQYSINFCTKVSINLYVYHAVLDQQLNFINDFQVILTQEYGVLWKKTKVTMKTDKYLITRDQVKELHQIYSNRLSQPAGDVIQLLNNNFVLIYQEWKDINSQVQTQGQSLAFYYLITDSDYKPLTIEAKVIENNYLMEKLINVLVFDDSFTILIEQISFYNQNKANIIAQRFDNSGARIGSYQFIDEDQSSPFRITIQQQDKYVMLWQKYDYSKGNNYILAQKYDKSGQELSWSNVINCIQNCGQCKNSQYCDTCNENYTLDENYQCKLICPTNCNTCTVLNQCEVCNQGYKITDGQCTQIQCISNCGICSLDGTCTQCSENYQFNGDNSQCQPICASNCNSCTTPLQCDSCGTGYELTATKTCSKVATTVVDEVKNTVVGTPQTAYFDNGDYILLWYQSGENAGVYFQLYSKDGNKLGTPTKVGGIARRRLLSQIEQQYAADLAINKDEFTVFWLDASKDSTVASLQKFNKTGEQLSEIIQLGSYPQVDLSSFKQPCQIKKTENNMIVAYYAQNQDSDYNMVVQTIDTSLKVKAAQQIQNVNVLSAPTITNNNGTIYVSYQSQGYLYVQKLTQDGNLIDQPLAISDPNSLIIKTTTLLNGMIVFEWENKDINYTLNYQLISKDLKTKSQVMSINTKQIAELQPDIQSFNEGFITVWKITDNQYQSQGLQFQIFNSLGGETTEIIDVLIDGLYPQNPSIQVINSTMFVIGCTAKKVDSDFILGDSIFIQKYDQWGNVISDQQSLCSYQCQSCRSPLNCYKCQSGYYLNDQQQCIMDCGTFCESCSTPFVCKQCQNGYYLANNKECVEIECLEGYSRNQTTRICDPQCSDQCQFCKLPSECSACNLGYALSNGQCDQIVTTNQKSEIEIFLIALVVLLTVTVICIGIYTYLLKKRLKQRVSVAPEPQTEASQSQIPICRCQQNF